MTKVPLKSIKNTIGNIKNVGAKTGKAAGRIKDYGSRTASAVQQGDTPEEGAARTAYALGSEIVRDAKDLAKKPVNKAIETAKKKVQKSLKQHNKADLKLKGRNSQQFQKEAGQTARNTAQETAKDSVKRTAGQTEHVSRNSAKGTAKPVGHAGRSSAKEAARSVERGAERTVRTAEQAAEKTAKETARTAQKTIRTTERAAARTAEKSAQIAKSTVRQVGREAQHVGKMGVKTGKWAAKATAKMTSWAVKSTAKMTAWSTRVAAKASAKAAVKATQLAVKASVKAAQLAAKAAAYAAKVAAAAAKAAAAVITALVQAIAAFLAAGGWILLVILIVAVVVYCIINSISGIQYSVDEDGNSQVLKTEVTRLVDEYYESADRKMWHFRNRYNAEKDPVFIFNGAEVSADGGELFYVNNMADVMAVFYTEIMTGMSGQESINYITEERKERLTEIFEDMNSLEIKEDHTEKIREEPEEGEIEGDVQQYIVYLNVNLVSLTAEEAADLYGFNETQRECLASLTTDEAYDIISKGIGMDADGSYAGKPVTVNPNVPANMLGGAIVHNAERYLGKSYSSMDCSALVRKAYQDTGLDWGGTSTTMAKNCVNMNVVIDQSQLMPGDLIFWKSDIGGGRCGNSRCKGKCSRWGQIHHVAIYYGDGKVIESVSKGVSINKIWETSKWKVAFCARPYVNSQSPYG